MSNTANISWPLFTTTSGNWANISWPLLAASGAGEVGTTGTAVVAVPLFSITAREGSGRGTLSWPLFSATATGEGGVVGTASLSFALFSLAAGGERSGAAALTFPLFSLSALGGPMAIGQADVLFPIFSLTASGRALLDVAATGDYEVWLVNTETKAHGTYTNWLANSLMEFNGKWFVAMPDGLYELIGELDQTTAINAAVYWPPSDMNTDMQKRLDAAYLAVRCPAGGALRVVSVCDETEKRIYTKDLTGFPQGMHPKRQQFTRGLKGRMWQIGVENVAGAAFDLAEVEILTIPESRRLK